MKKALIIFSVIVCRSILSFGQTELSFENALIKTLANNYDIQVAQIEEEIAINNSDRSAQGYLPSVSTNGSYNWTYYGGNQKLITENRNLDANSSYSYQANAVVSYMLFDGFGRKFRYQQSVGNRELSTLELRGIMESAVLDLSRSFYEVARLQQQNASLDSTLRVSKLRLLRARYAEEFGQSTALDILNAKVDFNTDSINLISGRQLEENAKRNLNLIMGEDIETNYSVVDKVEFNTNTTSDLAVQATLANGNLVERARQINDNAELSINSVRSDWYPELGLNAGYDYRGTDDPNGAFLIGSNNFGPSAGISLSWSLFDGTRKSRLANAKLGVESSSIQLRFAEQQAKTLALNAHSVYQNALAVMRTSESNVQTATDNFDRSQESFKLGIISSVEFRQAQVNLLAAKLQLNEAKYAAKNAELELLALMGKLISE